MFCSQIGNADFFLPQKQGPWEEVIQWVLSDDDDWRLHLQEKVYKIPICSFILEQQKRSQDLIFGSVRKRTTECVKDF